MDREKRKEIVIRLLTTAHERAAQEAEIIRSEPAPSFEFVFEHLRSYVLAKYLLPDNCSEEKIKTLAELSVARSQKLDPDVIKQYDKALPCDNVSSASAKRVMLLYSVQKDLGIRAKAADLIANTTLRELAEFVWSHLQNRGDIVI